MPYAQLHYPFENKELIDCVRDPSTSFSLHSNFAQDDKPAACHFPAQFIAEGVDQTRGWFYTLMVLSTALFDQPAFLNCIVNGIVLAEDGQKMSKRLKNYPEPELIVNRYGADSLRYYLLVSPAMKAEDLRFSERGVDEVLKKFITILLNVVSFYRMYEETKLKANPRSPQLLDRWIVSQIEKLKQEVTSQLDEYDLVKASRPLLDFVTDLSTWYLRRSRERFKSEGKDKHQALETLKHILLEFSKILAPFTPFLAERVYREVGGEKESVHLETWPKFDLSLVEESLLGEMELVRQIVELGLAARAAVGIKVRQPLQKLKIQGPQTIEAGSPAQRLERGESINLIKDELNLKEIEFVSEIKSEVGFEQKTDGEITVALQTEITSELEKEGLVRELVRQINARRKELGLTIKDSVVISYETHSAELKEVIDQYGEKLAQSVLARKIEEGPGGDELKIDHQSIRIKIIK